MAIQVTCPGCHKRFKVSDKFAGQKGPCPQCKAEIQIPAQGDEVVVHAPETSGPTDSTGRAVLEPIGRSEAKFSVMTAVIVAVIALVMLSVAFALRSPEGDPPLVYLVIGSIAIAPLVVRAGYFFLRDDELEPYRGMALWGRILICSGSYALLWGVYSFGVKGYVFQGDPLEIFHVGIIIPLMVAAGGFAAFASLELDYLNGVIHYGMYLLISVVLRLIMNMPAY